MPQSSQNNKKTIDAKGYWSATLRLDVQDLVEDIRVPQKMNNSIDENSDYWQWYFWVGCGLFARIQTHPPHER